MKKLHLLVPFLLVLVAAYSVVGCAAPAPVPTTAPTPAPAPAPAPSPTAAPAPITIKVAAQWTSTSSDVAFIKLWMNELMKRTNRVKFDEYWGGALVKPLESLSAVQSRLVDIYWLNLGYFPSDLALVSCVDMLYLTSSFYVKVNALKELYDTYQPVKDEFTRSKVYLATSMDAGSAMLTTKFPVATMDDLRGHSVRVFGGTARALTLLEGSPVSLPMTELYDAMSKGAVEGTYGNPVSVVDSQKFYEICKYIVDTDVGCFGAAACLINLDFFNSLPSDVKKAIEDTSNAYPNLLAAAKNQADKETVTKLIGQGVKFSHLTPAESQRWREKILPIYHDEWVKDQESKGRSNARDTLEFYKNLIKKIAPGDKYVPAF